MSWSNCDESVVAEASLHPPIHGEGPHAGGPATPASVLLDYRAYIDGRRNATTAWSKTRGGHSISVTFWPAHPPRVSCFSVCCPDLKPGGFAEEPVIVATEDDVVVLSVLLGNRRARHRYDYFVYQAGGGSGVPPSLELLKHPGPSRDFEGYSVGLLRCPKLELDDSQPTLRSHQVSRDDGGFYIVAALCYAPPKVPGHYDLYAYDSRTKEWTTRTALLRQEQELGHHSSHCSTKVIAVGGKAGTMGWVDLRQGILFCDVLLPDHTLPLTYISFPPPLKPDRKVPPDDRDIAVVKGCIKYVEFMTHVRPGSVIDGDFIADDWTAVTWSRKATSAKSLESSSWQRGSIVRASQISARKKSVQFELLPKLFDDEGTPQPTLERLHTSHPTLSLHEDNVVYFTTKVHYRKDTKAWVLAVNSKNKSLQGVAEFDALRTLGMNFTYMCSKISQHLHMAPGDYALLAHF